MHLSFPVVTWREGVAARACDPQIFSHRVRAVTQGPARPSDHPQQQGVREGRPWRCWECSSGPWAPEPQVYSSVRCIQCQMLCWVRHSGATAPHTQCDESRLEQAGKPHGWALHIQCVLRLLQCNPQSGTCFIWWPRVLVRMRWSLVSPS